MILNKQKTLEDITMYIATQFVNVPHENFNSRLNEALELIGKFLDVDRVYVFDYNFELNTASNTFEWCNENVSPEIDNLQNITITNIYDEWLDAHISGQMVIYEDVKSLGPESEVYQILNPQGVLSICTIPLIYQNECLGFVGFDDIRNTRKWKKSEIQLLKVLAELMVNLFIKKRNDEILIYLRDKAQKASDAKGQFLAQMSHEIRTPLNGIYNAFYLLKKKAHSEEQLKYLEIAQTSLDALSSIVNNILDLSKIEAGKMDINYVSTDLEASVTRILKTIRPTIISKGLECIFEFDYRINYEVVTDINKVNQIMLNLLNNAIKFTQQGSIKTKVTTKTIDDNEFFSITVSDTGIGIKEENLKHILEAFYQVSNQDITIKGTGLGLSIINEIIDLMGGSLHITSTYGEGSSFEVNLPLIKGEVLNFGENKGKKVLTFINDIKLKNQVYECLTSMGFQVDSTTHDVNSDYQFIVFDDLAVNNDLDVFSLSQRFGIYDVTTFLFSSKQLTSDQFDYVFDMPISRKAIMQRLMDIKDDSLINSDVVLSGSVLIVDDNDINLQALKAILESHGIFSETANSGIQAIEMVKINKYDMILMDIQMPQMDGYETSRIIRSMLSNQKPIPIIAVTANAFLSEYDVKMSSFINDVIYKPVKMDALIQLLQKYLSSTRIKQIPKNLMVFNKTLFESIFDQNLDAGYKMIEVFQSECHKDFSKMREAFLTKNKDIIYKALHHFKGPLSYMGGEKMMFLINELMNDSMSEHDITDVEIMQLQAELIALNDALKGYHNEVSSRR